MSETLDNPFMYSGELWDDTAELQYLRARWYDPSLGRFISEDSYEGDTSNPLTLNYYVYVANNPLIFIDPSGRDYLGFSAKELKEDYGIGSGSGGNYSEDLHAILDFLGLIPIIGELFDGVNGVIYLIEGEMFYAGLSAASMIPFYGWFSTGGKYLVKYGDEVFEVVINSTKDLKVIGKLDDTAVAKNWSGHDVLNDPNWTLAKNDEWVYDGIKNKQDFYIASPITEKNLISTNPNYPGDTVFAREIGMLKEAGYVQIGDYFIHPNNLK